ncbi:hypothetical protein [Pelomicrobium sp.]
MDWFIAAGQAMTVRAPGLTLIEAMQPSLATLFRPMPAQRRAPGR